MKYPLSSSEQFWRSAHCAFFGHQWASSWRRRPDFHDLVEKERGDIPYKDRKGKNPYYHYSAWWHYKCHRCRLKTTGYSYDAVWVRWFRGVRGFSYGLRKGAQSAFNPEIPKGKSLIAVMPMALCEGIIQACYPLEAELFFIMDFAVDIRDKLYSFLEPDTKDNQ